MRASFMPPNWGRIAQEPTFPAPHSSGCHLRSGSLSFFPYIGDMLWRNRRGRPLNAPAAFIHPCQPIVAKQPPIGPVWAHELKHDGYRLKMIFLALSMMRMISKQSLERAEGPRGNKKCVLI